MFFVYLERYVLFNEIPTKNICELLQKLNKPDFKSFLILVNPVHILVICYLFSAWSQLVLKKIACEIFSGDIFNISKLYNILHIVCSALLANKMAVKNKWKHATAGFLNICSNSQMFWGEISCQKKTAQGYLSAFCRSEKYNILQTCPRVQDILHTYQTLNFVTGDTIEQDIKARCVFF